MSIPRFKRVPIDYWRLYDLIIANGLTTRSLAKSIGISHTVFYQAEKEEKMNPAVLLAILPYVDFDVHEICKDFNFYRIDNGRSTSGRIPVDWDYLNKIASEKNCSFSDLSTMIGKRRTFLSVAKSVGGLTADIIVDVAKELDVPPEQLVKRERLMSKSIVDMINNQPY